MKDLKCIKWAMELTNQEGFKSPAEVTRAYNIMLGC